MSAEHPEGHHPPSPAAAPRAGVGAPRTEAAKNPLPFVIFILVLCGAGWLLVSQMSESARVQDCGMAGRKDCVPIDPKLGR